MLERRRHDRDRCFASGTIGFGPRRTTLDCVVRDLSEGGALLLVGEARRAPVEMELALRGGTRPARIVWRSETAVGIAFVPMRPAADAAPTSAVVVCLDAARRQRAQGSDERRLAERIARFVRPSRRPDPS